MDKEQLQNEMIRIFGLETPQVIEFFKLCENNNISIATLETVAKEYKESLISVMSEN